MKKFLFAAQLFLVLAMVPAAVYAYLHTNSDENTKNAMAKEVTNGQEDAATVSLVKLF